MTKLCCASEIGVMVEGWSLDAYIRLKVSYTTFASLERTFLCSCLADVLSKIDVSPSCVEVLLGTICSCEALSKAGHLKSELSCCLCAGSVGPWQGTDFSCDEKWLKTASECKEHCSPVMVSTKSCLRSGTPLALSL